MTGEHHGDGWVPAQWNARSKTTGSRRWDMGNQTTIIQYIQYIQYIQSSRATGTG